MGRWEGAQESRGFVNFPNGFLGGEETANWREKSPRVDGTGGEKGGRREKRLTKKENEREGRRELEGGSEGERWSSRRGQALISPGSVKGDDASAY